MSYSYINLEFNSDWLYRKLKVNNFCSISIQNRKTNKACLCLTPPLIAAVAEDWENSFHGKPTQVI